MVKLLSGFVNSAGAVATCGLAWTLRSKKDYRIITLSILFAMLAADAFLVYTTLETEMEKFWSVWQSLPEVVVFWTIHWVVLNMMPIFALLSRGMFFGDAQK